MASQNAGIHDAGVAAEILAVAEAHGLSASVRRRFLRVVTGTIPGNRDRPAFLLAKRICAAGISDPFDLMLPGRGVLGQLDGALLDFLVTAAVADRREFDTLITAFTDAPSQPDPVRALASVLSRVLHGYRSRALPEARHHNLFTAIRRFYARHRPGVPEPRDGDALTLWEEEGTRAFLTRHVTALNGLADFVEAARLAASWRHGVSLDDEGAPSLPEGAGADMAEDDPLAPDRLQASLAALSEAPVKLLLAREIEEIGALAAISGAARRWPSEMLAALCFGPVQNAITEALRRGTLPTALSPYLERAEHYEDLCARHALLQEKLLDALHLIHLGTLSGPERAAARSSLSSQRRKRIEAMERRRSLAEMDATRRQAALMALVEPLTTLRALLEPACAAWEVCPPDALGVAQRDHKARFLAKFSALYAEQDAGQDAGQGTCHQTGAAG